VSHSSSLPKLRVRQAPERGHYERDVVHSILDASLVGHVSFVDEGLPVSIPTAVARIHDALYLHGNRSSRMFKLLAAGVDICVSTCIVDGLVKARSGMHCSMNYRSVVVYGTSELVEDDEKPGLLHEIVQKLIPGTDGDYRDHLSKELKATALVRVSLDQSTAKIRAEGVHEDEDDLTLPHWSGIIPIARVAHPAQPDESVPESNHAPEEMVARIQRMID